MIDSGTRIAIHQPTFLPWVKYFSKIVNTDIFVFLDDVQYPQTSKGTWINRHQLLNSGKPVWFSVPVSRKLGNSKEIRDVKIDPNQDWKLSYKNKIASYYATAEYFKDTFQVLTEILDAHSSTLICENNLYLIQKLLELFRLPLPEFVLSSDLGVSCNGTDRLVEICEKLSGKVYFCGNGSAGYLDEQKFLDRGLHVKYQNINQAHYHQDKSNQFWPGLSIVDTLMNVGVNNSRRMILEN